MDPLDCQTDEELSNLFHCKKTEISSMEEPQAFLNELRKPNLVPENLYQKVMKMRTTERRQDIVYQILDQLEKKGGHSVRLFWRCVFRDCMLQKYPILRLLWNSLKDGSSMVYKQIPDAPEEPNRRESDKKGLKRKKSIEGTDEEEPGPSSCSTPQQKKPAPLLKEREIHLKKQLPVTCGDKKGMLHKEKLERGDRCILSEGLWFTPGNFEKFAGKRSKKWKESIRCSDIPLQKLIEERYLKAPPAMKPGVQKDHKVPFTDTSTESSSSSGSSSPQSTSSVELVELGKEEEDDDEEEEEEEDEESEPVDLLMFEAPSLPVSCGSFSGVLYKNRFTGPNSKSIRTEERWFTPEEFVNQESTLTDVHWRKDILCHGKTLHYLEKKKILVVHLQHCFCDRCHHKEPVSLNNDDICFICNSEGDLVCCDECPRAFHDNCHLPNLQKETLGDKWTCTFCMCKTFKGPSLPMTKEDSLNLPLSKTMMHYQYLLLCLYKEDKKRVFTGDPTATVEGYSRVILKPMWLDRVKTKLQNKEYKTVGEFVNDIRLIFQNCSKFNMDNEVGRVKSRMEEIFEQEFHKVFNFVSHILPHNNSRQMEKSNISPSNHLDFVDDKKISSMMEEDNFLDKPQNYNLISEDLRQNVTGNSQSGDPPPDI
ncbi:nuclear body protein SP140-like protein [Trichomycterus rosablanca]|uniref:nuclear body protein SP140-like protein n=1 Tax=Trichomycterus rosablanca TaxID=2290929 RepID=UPI002F35C68D